MKIFKYELEATDVQTVSMPFAAEILSAQVQHGRIRIWAKVDPTRDCEGRTIVIAGTGHEINEPGGRLVFIDTVQLHGGSLVFHVFERVSIAY